MAGVGHRPSGCADCKVVPQVWPAQLKHKLPPSKSYLLCPLIAPSLPTPQLNPHPELSGSHG
jgi:hypothetical protein